MGPSVQPRGLFSSDTFTKGWRFPASKQLFICSLIQQQNYMFFSRKFSSSSTWYQREFDTRLSCEPDVCTLLTANPRKSPTGWKRWWEEMLEL